MADKTSADGIVKLLKKSYPAAHCSLRHKNPFQLLAATILSAQCTDARVNMVTPLLFKRYPGPAEMGGAPLDSLEKLVHSTGFYKNKAKNMLKKILRVMWGQEKLKIIVEDPSGNSAIISDKAVKSSLKVKPA